MRVVKIIEALYEGKDKYKVWHDFNKEDISEYELESTVARIIFDIRNGKIKDRIKDNNIYCVMFEDDKLIDVMDMIEIWDNIPHELMKDYADDYNTIKDFIDSYRDAIIKGFMIDSSFNGGEGLFIHLGVTDEE